jgi:hypothetical protein
MQTYASGFPVRVTSRSSIPGIGAIWPELVPGVPIKAVAGCGNVQPGNPSSRYLNNNAFRSPNPFTLGNASVLSNVSQCGILTEDYSIRKTFPITEHTQLIFGSLISNLFNRHQFYGLNTDTDNVAGFGTFTAATPSRAINFFLRVEF